MGPSKDSKTTSGDSKADPPARKDDRPPNLGSCPVVGIGASADGLEACKAFLDAMPGDSGIAFVAGAAPRSEARKLDG
jgi:two-component system CheB/CheR fusion protein